MATMHSVPELETERLRLRGYELRDFEGFHQCWSDPRILRHIAPGTGSRESSWRRFSALVGHWQLRGYGIWALERKGEEPGHGVVIGSAGFLNVERDIGFDLDGCVELAWALAPDFHRQNYASEAMRAVYAWGAEFLADRQPVALIDADNAPSRRLASKLGLRRVAETSKDDAIVLLYATQHRTWLELSG